MKYKKVFAPILFAVTVFFFFANSPTVHAATSISTCAALQNISTTGLNTDYVLASDIDCSGIANFSRVGTFTGTLDGQGHTISNLTVDPGFLSDQVALFSATDGAVIRNLSITNAHIVGYTKVGVLIGQATNTVITNVTVSSGITMFGLGSGGNVGGLVGYASNTHISYSSAAVPINAAGSNVGGLVGFATNGTVISKSYSTAQVGCTASGGGNVGGLVGLNDSSTIVDSYSLSYMQGGIFWINSVGGLVGTNDGNTALIDRSYSVNGFNINGAPQGLVGSQTNGAATTNSFWDTTVSGLGSSAGGTGRNTAQMQTQGTFVSGWDFSNVWVIGGYPTFQAGDITAPTTPTDFTSVATGSNVHLAWTNPTDLDFVSVYVRRSSVNSPSAALAGTDILSGSLLNSYDDNGLADGTYYYSVIALDTNGNYSIPARATVLVDTTPPATPTTLTAPVAGSVVTLHWINPGAADFASVTITRDTVGYPATINNGTPVIAGLVGTSYPNTVPADGAYYYSVFARDNTGNYSAPGQVTAIVDTAKPVLAMVTSVPTYTNDVTPGYIFTSTKAGDVTYGGSCASATTTANVGSNTIALNALAIGTYSGCTITVTDSFGNESDALAIATFTIDTTAPILTTLAEVGQNVLASNAQYVFSTTETGTYILSGCAGSVDDTSHVVRFVSLAPGTYSCTLTQTDLAGNISNTLTIQPFTIRAAPGGAVIFVVDVATTSGTLGFTVGELSTSTMDTLQVKLLFNADPKTVQGYAISFDPLFKDAGIISYTPTKMIDIPKAPGSYNIYVKYYSTTGRPSGTFSQTVTHTGHAKVSVPTVGIVSETSGALGLTRTLKRGMTGEDVRRLQAFLNTHGYVVAASGAGSLGNETTYFGPRLAATVVKYQKAKGIVPTSGIVGTLTRTALALDAN